MCDLARPGYRDTITYDIRRRDKIMTDGNGKEVEHHNFFFGARREKHSHSGRHRRGTFISILYVYSIHVVYIHTTKEVLT